MARRQLPSRIPSYRQVRAHVQRAAFESADGPKPASFHATAEGSSEDRSAANSADREALRTGPAVPVCISAVAQGMACGRCRNGKCGVGIRERWVREAGPSVRSSASVSSPPDFTSARASGSCCGSKTEAETETETDGSDFTCAQVNWETEPR